MAESQNVTTRTLDCLLSLYELEFLPLKAPSTQKSLRSLVRVLRRDLGALPLSALTPPTLRAWRDETLRRCQPGTVRQYMSGLQAILRIAAEDLEWIVVDPLRKVTRPHASPARVRYLSREEQARLLAACRASSTPALYPLVFLALSTGARQGEMLRLRWGDVDLERGALRLTHTKNGESRPVPLPAIAAQVLLAWRSDAGLQTLVFPRPGSRSRFPFEYAWRQARARAGLEDFRFHDLRHTAASYLALSGARLEDIADVLGHKSLQVTRRYRHVTLAHTAALVERMAQEMLRG